MGQNGFNIVLQHSALSNGMYIWICNVVPRNENRSFVVVLLLQELQPGKLGVIAVWWGRASLRGSYSIRPRTGVKVPLGNHSYLRRNCHCTSQCAQQQRHHRASVPLPLRDLNLNQLIYSEP
jgi:hypothetical protein